VCVTQRLHTTESKRMIYCYWPTSFLTQPPTPHWSTMEIFITAFLKSFSTFFQGATSQIRVVEDIVFSLSYHFSLSIKQIFLANLCALPDYFRVLLRKKKKTIIRLTEMSEILRTEKFPEETNTISTFSLSHDKFRNFDLLISFHRSLRNFAISHTVRVLHIKSSNANVLWLLCMNWSCQADVYKLSKHNSFN